ncbi:hypothetical protein ACFYE9_33030 [Rhizobium leguminosarum]|uniref:Uncharacterized protein n=1 Tax=Rhizobium leguminosarum TaxID=384 RepID=A0ACD5FDN3_RHILE|nr:hypothetical protein [Rhizobium leguminosarum]
MSNKNPGVAVITGAAAGIGRATAKALASAFDKSLRKQMKLPV